MWVSDSPAALADSSAQSPGDLKDDGVHKTHVEKDFVAFCSSTPRTCLSLVGKVLWELGLPAFIIWLSIPGNTVVSM